MRVRLICPIQGFLWEQNLSGYGNSGVADTLNTGFSMLITHTLLFHDITVGSSNQVMLSMNVLAY